MLVPPLRRDLDRGRRERGRRLVRPSGGRWRAHRSDRGQHVPRAGQLVVNRVWRRRISRSGLPRPTRRCDVRRRSWPTRLHRPRTSRRSCRPTHDWPLLRHRLPTGDQYRSVPGLSHKRKWLTIISLGRRLTHGAARGCPDGGARSWSVRSRAGREFCPTRLDPSMPPAPWSGRYRTTPAASSSSTTLPRRLRRVSRSEQRRIGRALAMSSRLGERPTCRSYPRGSDRGSGRRRSRERTRRCPNCSSTSSPRSMAKVPPAEGWPG